MSNKIRLDKLLVQNSLFNNRSKAQIYIRSGKIVVNNRLIDKPGHLVELNSDITIKQDKKYVGRGGLKLEPALKYFNPVIKSQICLDIGASTGGFTHCLLVNGAKKVYALDVGYGQLDYTLRKNEQVIVMEKTNARYIVKDNFPDMIDLITIDVSFISLTKIIPSISNILQSGKYCIPLIKPQFEAERKDVTKGVVRNIDIHKKVIAKVVRNFVQYGFSLQNQPFMCPLKGPKGNKEFFIYVKKE